ncbi:hypothetical protein G3T14_08560 [Methylobacterium sp. BTF04]|nr:hypothetical protein [Methylobacterium sp. BTF04]
MSILATGVAVAAAGCSGDLSPMRAVYGSGDAKPVKAPDFVENSRKDGGDFMPVGVSAPARQIRAKSSEGTKTLEAELEGARGRNEAKGRAAASAGKATTPAKPPVLPRQE